LVHTGSALLKSGRIAMLQLLMALLMAAGVVTAPVSTTQPRKVYVETYGVPASWGVTQAMNWVDGYTKTDMVRARCVSGYKCIRIGYVTVNPSWAAVTFGSVTCSACLVTIKLNPQRRSYSPAVKRAIVEHEIGHANGITWHNNGSCNNRMYWQVFCPNGKIPPRAFTARDKARLRVH
jgi:hypothetical protein